MPRRGRGLRISGNLGIGVPAPGARLDVLGWDVAGGEGDIRVGSPTYRLKMGVATAGGGAGNHAITFDAFHYSFAADSYAFIDSSSSWSCRDRRRRRTPESSNC